MKKRLLLLTALVFALALFHVAAGADETPRRTVIIGDSRAAHLKKDNEQHDEWIAEPEKGYSWFSCTAVRDLGTLLKHDSLYNVVLFMGINDCNDCANEGHSHHASEYARTINSLMETWPDARFFVCTAGPEDGTAYERTRSKGVIEEFNRVLTEECRASVIDIYGFLTEEGYETRDGIHYTPETDRRIYAFIMQEIESASQPGEQS